MIGIRNDLKSRIRILNDLGSRIRIRNYHQGSGLMESKCSEKDKIFDYVGLVFTNNELNLLNLNFTKKISMKFKTIAGSETRYG